MVFFFVACEVNERYNFLVRHCATCCNDDVKKSCQFTLKRKKWYVINVIFSRSVEKQICGERGENVLFVYVPKRRKICATTYASALWRQIAYNDKWRFERVFFFVYFTSKCVDFVSNVFIVRARTQFRFEHFIEVFVIWNLPIVTSSRVEQDASEWDLTWQSQGTSQETRFDESSPTWGRNECFL